MLSHHHATVGGEHAAGDLRHLRILAITPAPTHPTTAGNRARFRSLLDRVQAQGACVRLAHVQHEAGDFDAMQAHWSGGAVRIPFVMPEPARHLWNRVVHRLPRGLPRPFRARAALDDWHDPASTAAIHHEVRAFRPDVVVMLYLWNSAALVDLPRSVHRVLDAQDVFTDRTERLRRAGIEQEWFSIPQREEARGLDRFDTILAIQEHEAAFYRTLSRRRVVTVGHFIPILAPVPPAADDRVLLIGSDNDINIHGMRWFVAEVWPTVRQARPTATLDVVGRLSEHVPPADGVTARGRVPDLTDAYATSALVVSPLRGGTGLKIKTAEALGAGRVCVSTTAAGEGLEAAVGRGLVICDDADDTARTILGLLHDRRTLTERSAAAHAFAMEWNAINTARFDAVFAAVSAPAPTTDG